MKLVGCAVMALTMIAGSASAGDWRLTSVNESGAVGVDMATARGENIRRVWGTALFPETNAGGVDYVLMRFQIDCAAETMAQTSVAAYSAAGVQIDRFDLPTAPKAVVPDTGESSILDAVCFNKFVSPDDVGWEDVRELLGDYRAVKDD